MAVVWYWLFAFVLEYKGWHSRRPCVIVDAVLHVRSHQKHGEGWIRQPRHTRTSETPKLSGS